MINKVTSWLHAAGFTATKRGQSTASARRGSSPANEQPVAADGIIDRGTGEIEWIQQDADGKIKFKVNGFQWPFQDSRGVDVVSGLFDQETGITAEILRGNPTITHDKMMEWYRQPLQAEYIKKKKGDKTYWDVVRVYL
jgi:hypothetical protein